MHVLKASHAKRSRLGGGGISMEGDDHIIQNNIFAGLRQEVFKITTQSDAIRVTGTGHLIQNNQIGVDALANKVGIINKGEIPLRISELASHWSPKDSLIIVWGYNIVRITAGIINKIIR